MNPTRRDFVRLGIGAAAYVPARRLLAQGVSSHTAKALPRPAASGRPFDAHFVDIATFAGLTAPVTYGGLETNRYIVESTGCGCAFIDYDNDGWMDLFVLCGTRLEGAPEGARTASTRTTATAPLQMSRRRRAYAPLGGLVECALATITMMVSTISFALVLDRTSSTATMAMELLPMSPKQPDCGTHNSAGVLGCSFVDFDRDGHLDLFVSNYVRLPFDLARSIAGRKQQLQLEGDSRGMRTTRTAHGHVTLCTGTMETEHSPT